jgi:uncharacterized protein YbjT (DUF2867 family)
MALSSSPVLVTGGTGTLGRLVVPKLLAAGRDVRVLSRGGAPAGADGGASYVAGDLLQDGGVGAAVDGVRTILHLAGGPKGDDEATRNLVRAVRERGGAVEHVILISVVGADRVPIGYFRAKHGAEEALRSSGLPFSILRAAQFHDFVAMIGRKVSRLPVVPAPAAVRWQPVDAGAVASRLVALASGAPTATAEDLSGPDTYTFPDLLRSFFAADGRRRLLLPLRLPGKVGAAYRSGANLSDDGTTAGRTWEAFLAERVRPGVDLATARSSSP